MSYGPSERQVRHNQREVHRLIPSIAQREDTQHYDVFAGLMLPPDTGALESHREQTLTGRLDVPASDRQVQTSRAGVVHTSRVIGRVRDCVVRRTIVA